MLVVVAVKEGELLLAVGGIVNGVDVQRDPRRRLVEAVQELPEEFVAEAPQVGDGDGVLKP